MALSGITFDPIQAYGKEYKLLACKVVVGASGAVASIDGKGFGSGPLVGSVTKQATAGQYTFVLPGRGSVHDIVLLGCYVQHATDALFATIVAISTTARSMTIQLRDAAGAAANASSDAVIHVAFLAKNSSID